MLMVRNFEKMSECFSISFLGSEWIKVGELSECGVHVGRGNPFSPDVQSFEGVSLLLFLWSFFFLSAVDLALKFVKVIVGRRHFTARLVDHLLQILDHRFRRLEFVYFGDFT